MALPIKISLPEGFLNEEVRCGYNVTEKLKKICLGYNSFCVMGGNVFVLRQAMKYSGFDTILEEKKRFKNLKE